MTDPPRPLNAAAHARPAGPAPTTIVSASGMIVLAAFSSPASDALSSAGRGASVKAFSSVLEKAQCPVGPCFRSALRKFHQWLAT
jgi:hypothetical protein